MLITGAKSLKINYRPTLTPSDETSSECAVFAFQLRALDQAHFCDVDPHTDALHALLGTTV